MSHLAPAEVIAFWVKTICRLKMAFRSPASDFCPSPVCPSLVSAISLLLSVFSAALQLCFSGLCIDPWGTRQDAEGSMLLSQCRHRVCRAGHSWTVPPHLVSVKCALCGSLSDIGQSVCCLGAEVHESECMDALSRVLLEPGFFLNADSSL